MRRRQGGFTLIELVVVMVLMTILTGFVANVIFYEMNTYATITARKEGGQNVRFATRILSRDLRQIAAPDSIFAATQDSVRFRDIEGSDVSYRHVGSNLLRNGDLLLEDMTVFAFSYYDESGTSLAFPIGDFSSIRSVSFALATAVNGQTAQVQMRITPRNF